MTASPAIAAPISSTITSRISSTPVAASAPAVNSSESPGRNGQMISPVSMKMMANSIA
ncbi:hypothetical protein D3C83_197060 [compost metagenome]